jgi:hypothetical protein
VFLRQGGADFPLFRKLLIQAAGVFAEYADFITQGPSLSLRYGNLAEQGAFLRAFQAGTAYCRPKAIQFRFNPFRPAVYPLDAGRYVRAGYGKFGAVSVGVPLDCAVG